MKLLLLLLLWYSIGLLEREVQLLCGVLQYHNVAVQRWRDRDQSVQPMGGFGEEIVQRMSRDHIP